MKKLITLCLALLLFGIAYAQNPVVRIEVKNPMNLDRTELVSISWQDVLKAYPGIDTAGFQLIDIATKKEIPYQLERLGQANVQNLLLQVSVKAGQTLKISGLKRKPAPVVTRTYARYVPERKDDFAWENDKVAFRMYGKALENTSEDAKGIDVWVKSTDRMVINERYKRGKYHEDQGDGMDYYHVGNSLGAGNSAPYIKDNIYYSMNYHTWKVLDNGPLRSTFQLGYDEWDAAGLKVKAVKTISLDAGSHLAKVNVDYTFPGDTLPIAVGIIKRPDGGVISIDEQKGIMGYWEPQIGNYGITGVGVLINQKLQKSVINSQILGVSKAVNNKTFSYYTGSCWNKAGQFTNAQAWFGYLNDYAAKLKQPLTVTIAKYAE